MPRPFKPRRVSTMPRHTYFKPTGIPMTLLDEDVLTADKEAKLGSGCKQHYYRHHV